MICFSLFFFSFFSDAKIKEKKKQKEKGKRNRDKHKLIKAHFSVLSKKLLVGSSFLCCY